MNDVSRENRIKTGETQRYSHVLRTTQGQRLERIAQDRGVSRSKLLRGILDRAFSQMEVQTNGKQV